MLLLVNILICKIVKKIFIKISNKIIGEFYINKFFIFYFLILYNFFFSNKRCENL